MIRINFTEPTYESVSWLIREVIYLVISLALVAVVIFFDQNEINRQLDMARGEIASLEQEKAKYGKKKEQYNKMKSELAEYSGIIDSLKQVFQGRGIKGRILEQLQVNTPKKVWFSSLDLSDEGISLNGSAANASEISYFLTNLMNTKENVLLEKKNLERDLDYKLIYFDDIKLMQVSQKSDSAGFKIDLKMKFIE